MIVVHKKVCSIYGIFNDSLISLMHNFLNENKSFYSSKTKEKFYEFVRDLDEIAQLFFSLSACPGFPDADNHDRSLSLHTSSSLSIIPRQLFIIFVDRRPKQKFQHY